MRVYLNISMVSYLGRPIFDVFMNGTDFGEAPPQGFYGTNAIMLNQAITLGAQKIMWRWADSGETVTAKNVPVLNEIPPGVKWLALHIYDDETVELALSKGSPDELETARGKKIIEAWEKKHGK